MHGNSATRAINIYNGEPVHNAPITDHRIHHNVIIDQEWDAVLFGGGTVGENSFHDNLVIRSGLLNAFPDYTYPNFRVRGVPPVRRPASREGG